MGRDPGASIDLRHRLLRAGIMETAIIRKVDATGRSGKVKRLGYAKKWKLDAPFIAHSREFRESIAFRSLNFPARRVLDFLELEHLRNAGFENGYLAAPYRQIQATGMSKRDVPKAIQMLKAFGFIARTDVNMRLAGRKNMARYRLTYLPDRSGNLPTDEWRKIERKHVEAFKADSKSHPD